MSATRPVVRFGLALRAVVNEEGVFPQVWTGTAWEPGGDLRDYRQGRVLSRKELAERGIPFDPDTVDQMIIAARGWNFGAKTE
jgi:hypothetical protein